MTLWESQEFVLSEEGRLIRVGITGPLRWQSQSQGPRAQPRVGGEMEECGSAFLEPGLVVSQLWLPLCKVPLCAWHGVLNMGLSIASQTPLACPHPAGRETEAQRGNRNC